MTVRGILIEMEVQHAYEHKIILRMPRQREID